MCIRCGGTCGAAHEGPRFTRHAGVPERPRVVGTAAGPTDAPDRLIRVQSGLITYETLYTTLTPSGERMLAVIPGTFGNWATKAGKGR